MATSSQRRWWLAAWAAAIGVALLLGAVGVQAGCRTSADYLRAINAARARFQAPALAWNATLASQATALAQGFATTRSCLIASPLFLPTNVSQIRETRALARGRVGNFAQTVARGECSSFVDRWWQDSLGYYQFGAKDPLKTNFLDIPFPVSRGPTGELAQLIWRPTKQVGCAVAQATTCWVAVCVFDRFFMRDVFNAQNPNQALVQNVWPPAAPNRLPPLPGYLSPPPQGPPPGFMYPASPPINRFPQPGQGPPQPGPPTNRLPPPGRGPPQPGPPSGPPPGFMYPPSGPPPGFQYPPSGPPPGFTYPPQPGPPPSCADRSTACKIWAADAYDGCSPLSPWGWFEGRSVPYYWCRNTCGTCGVTNVPTFPPPGFMLPPPPPPPYTGPCKPTPYFDVCRKVFGMSSRRTDCDGDGKLDLVCSPNYPYDYMVQFYLVYLSSKSCEASTDFIGLYDVPSTLLPNYLPGKDPLELVCPGVNKPQPPLPPSPPEPDAPDYPSPPPDDDVNEPPSRRF